jgi:hypothetical protein
MRKKKEWEGVGEENIRHKKYKSLQHMKKKQERLEPTSSTLQ